MTAALLVASLVVAPHAGANPAAGSASELESPSSEVQRAGDVDPEQLRRAMLPEPTGDAFFDVVPDGLDEAIPGEVLEHRDVMHTAASLTPVPLARAEQYLVRSTEPGGGPTRATATLLTPSAPWTGEGARPVLVNAVAIDSLGSKCTPGYAWGNGPGAHSSPISIGPPVTDDALAAGHAVLIPDHQGPEMAYADPYVAGYSILDTIRGLGDVAPGLSGSPVVMTGYSGGAIALNGAVKLIDGYAPELESRIKGASLGGAPADFEMLLDSMSGNLAIGLLTAAILGLFRHNPEIVPLANDRAIQLATSPIKDQCLPALAAAGVTQTSIDALIVPGGLDSPDLREFFAHTRMSDLPSAVPLHIYHGRHEFWVPVEAARNLATEQRALGVPVEYDEVPGEHFVATYTGYDESTEWLDARIRGERPPP